MTVIALVQLFLTGALAGLAAGFMGIGGGAVLTPLCLMVYPALGINGEDLVKIIFGTNMFLVMVFSISAVIRHHGNKKIDWRTVLILGPLAILGSLTGAWIASVSDSALLYKTFSILLLVSSLLIVTRGSTKPGGDIKNRKALLPLRLLPVLGFVAGAAGSFLGIGGGVIMIPSLILLFAFPVDRVAGTSSSVIIFIGFAGMLSYMWHGAGEVDLPGWSSGYVWWSAAVPLALGGVMMAQVGAWINSRLHTKILQRIFGLVLLVIAIKMLFL